MESSRYTYPIRGIPLPDVTYPGSAPIPLRMEFSKWSEANPIQFSLFIQALELFYKMEYEDELSYFRIAAIHGLPGIAWDDAPPPANIWPTKPNEHLNVYCTHNMITFPVWHRLYMVLFEQRIYELMLQVVSEIKFDEEKKTWEAEAKLWRLPYWDEALAPPHTNQLGLPTAYTEQYVTFWLPKDSNSGTRPLDTKPNPLNGYKTKNGEKMGDLADKKLRIKDIYAGTDADNKEIDSPWSQCAGTSRCAVKANAKGPIDPALWEAGANNWALSNQDLRSTDLWYYDHTKGHTITDLVYRLFTTDYLKSWHTFASTKYTPDDKVNDPQIAWTEFLSLEYIHNNLHNFIGGPDISVGTGHMADPPVASFDPIFWVHHCNIDRSLAIWQALNPEKWFDAPPDGKVPDDPKPEDPLQPFHYDTQGHVWTSNGTKDWTRFGYQYEVLERKPGESDEDYKKQLLKALNVYNQTSQLMLGVGRSITHDDGLYSDYLVNILYDRYALGGCAYAIHFFLGKVSRTDLDVTTINSHPRRVGVIHTFSSGGFSPDDASCENCAVQMAAGTLSRAQIPLTVPLLHHALDPMMPDLHAPDLVNADTIGNYLKDNLDWVAVSATGVVLPPEKLPATKVFVVSGKAEHNADPAKMSRYLDYKPLPVATSGEHQWGNAGAGEYLSGF